MMTLSYMYQYSSKVNLRTRGPDKVFHHPLNDCITADRVSCNQNGSFIKLSTRASAEVDEKISLSR